MSQSTITGLEQLLALENIRNTKARYCRYIDTKQWDTLGDVFAPDAVADFSTEGNPIPVLTGRDTIVQVFRDLVDVAVTVHHVHSAEVEFVSENEAKVISQWKIGSRSRRAMRTNPSTDLGTTTRLLSKSTASGTSNIQV
ncbi:nuclear transport factor 2 family protein [Paenibacillus amylolyticus]|nr:nuclear transport factor 2 family protein [Paenibacillus amylolyticus]